MLKSSCVPTTITLEGEYLGNAHTLLLVQAFVKVR